VAQKIKIASIFPKYLFWDMDINSLDAQADEDIVIPRALYMTSKRTFEDDIKRLETVYTPSQIVSQLKKTKELVSNEVCELVSHRYMITPFYRFGKK
jgi:hypothetical protein